MLDDKLEIAITTRHTDLAGPGTIATAMNFASAGGGIRFIVTVGAFFVLCIISYVFCFW